MSAFISKPEDIPLSDRYSDVPFYGRYYPLEDDFHVDLEHIESDSEASLQYWESVLAKCDDSVRIYPAGEGGRDVFALGSVIVKSSHLHPKGEQETDYSFADANEVAATALARGILGDIHVPKMHFAGRLNGRQVLVQERLAGVGLNVAWPYLSPEQRQSFKEQTRTVLQQLYTVKPESSALLPSHVVPDPDILTNGRIGALEASILFPGGAATDATLTSAGVGLVHNDLTPSNMIVNDDRIVGVIDWEMAGFFPWAVAARVHERIRTPQREHFASANLSEDRLREIMHWNDLYDAFFKT